MTENNNENKENIRNDDRVEKVIKENVPIKIEKELESIKKDIEKNNLVNKGETVDNSLMQDLMKSEFERKKNIDKKTREKLPEKNAPKKSIIPFKSQLSSFRTTRDNVMAEANRLPDKEAEESENDTQNEQQRSNEEREAELNSSRIKVKSVETRAEVSDKGSSKVPDLRLVFDRLLKSMIRFTLTTWSLSMFYVYFHVLASAAFKKYFCSLGHEWVPDRVKKTNPKLAKQMGDRIGIAEKSLVGCCCSCHLFIVMIIVAIIYFIMNPLEVAWDFLKDWAEQVFE